jgi:hypothetical protein
MIRQKVEMILLATVVFWTTVIFITGLVLRDPMYDQITLVCMLIFRTYSMYLFFLFFIFLSITVQAHHF